MSKHYYGNSVTMDCSEGEWKLVKQRISPTFSMGTVPRHAPGTQRAPYKMAASPLCNPGIKRKEDNTFSPRGPSTGGFRPALILPAKWSKISGWRHIVCQIRIYPIVPYVSKKC